VLKVIDGSSERKRRNVEKDALAGITRRSSDKDVDA